MKLVVTYGVWREPQWLVDQMRANLAWADGFAEIDDRGRVGGWGHEGEYRARQRQACIDLGADWVLVTSPDERWESRAAENIRALVDQGPQDVVYRFPVHEMWTLTDFRVDGRWGRQRRTRLYPLHPGQEMSAKAIHAPPVPIVPAYQCTDVDVRIYHLKMINPANRPARAAAYRAAEAASGRRRKRGWRHLTDMTRLDLKRIETGRHFHPPYEGGYRFRSA